MRGHSSQPSWPERLQTRRTRAAPCWRNSGRSFSSSTSPRTASSAGKARSRTNSSSCSVDLRGCAAALASTIAWARISRAHSERAWPSARRRPVAAARCTRSSVPLCAGARLATKQTGHPRRHPARLGCHAALWRGGAHRGKQAGGESGAQDRLHRRERALLAPRSPASKLQRIQRPPTGRGQRLRRGEENPRAAECQTAGGQGCRGKDLQEERQQRRSLRRRWGGRGQLHVARCEEAAASGGEEAARGEGRAQAEPIQGLIEKLWRLHYK
mmetsp:Transcript_12875/g.37809  ORF Transcript_12875/g.37809 Transcript_12875/m.37809 type:complete len:271 (+) Transcript_12875:2266-3078(+)